MAIRPVFISASRAPYSVKIEIEFTYSGGFATVQKHKNIAALHQAFNRRFPAKTVLEISSRSMQPEGVQASAFNLRKYVPSLERSVPVENLFQGGKVFAAGGPFTDLYDVAPREAKRDERLKASGNLLSFYFEGDSFPLQPRTIFYDYLYISALRENPALAEQVLQYDAFTDIEFNPQKSLNCQARSAAVFVALSRLELINQVSDFAAFVQLFRRGYPYPQSRGI